MSDDSGQALNDQTLCKGLEGIYSVSLHVAAIIIVLLVSLFGTIMPIITKYIPILRRNPFVFVVAKTAAAGVLLSVSTIHLIGDSISAFNEPCVPQSFRQFYEPSAFFFALVAALIMHAVDYKLLDMAEKWLKRQENESAPDADKEGLVQTDLTDFDKTATAEIPRIGHSHGVAPPTTMAQLQKIIAAASMEFGVTLHSIFVGLDMGLTTDSKMKPLLIALVFHQLFEGMALGWRLVDANFGLALNTTLATVFSISAPLGMTISTIAVSIRKDAMAGSWFAVMLGTLSSFCGGILLYLAFSLLLTDFAIEIKAHCGEGTPNRTTKKVVMFSALWVGMFSMAIVGKWL